mgnify:CR=1 FL=1
MKSNAIKSPCYHSASYTMRTIVLFVCAGLVPLQFSCGDYFKNDYRDNSPTSGRLKVYCDEGMMPHVKNQSLTFMSQYPNAIVEWFEGTEHDAVMALYNDSCEAIVISRLLNEKEKNAFGYRQFDPKYSAVAKSGVAIICNYETPLSALSLQAIRNLVTSGEAVNDSTGRKMELRVLFDRNGSSVMRYITDSVIKTRKLSSNCSALASSRETINYIATHKGTLAFIDFAWLSDKDDSLYKANADKIRFVGITGGNGQSAEYPSQSSFKTGTYPFTRTVYVYRKTGDFTLAKGFESFVAGPKGQLTFLKQGLLPNRQAERVIEVKMEPLDVNP